MLKTLAMAGRAPASFRAAKEIGPAGLLLPLLVGVLLLPGVLGSSKTIFNDGDVSWHIANGRWILAHHAIPTTDPFSFTWAGKPWVSMEWLSDISYATAFNVAGYSGVAALVTFAMMALNGVVFLNSNRWTRFPLMVLACMDVVLVPMMLARPHVLTWPIIAMWTWLLMRAREQDRAPPPAAALLMALWGNLHASFIMGLLIAGAFGIEAVIASADRKRAARQWMIFGALCAAATCLNANGIHGVLYPLTFPGLKMLPMIDEWKHSNPQVTPFFFVVLAFTIALIVWKRPRMHPVRWLLLAALVGGALFQARHQCITAIVSAVVLPSAFAKGVRQPATPDLRPSLKIAATGAVLLLIVRLAIPITPGESKTNPWKLIATVPAGLRTQPVLNDYTMGGPLILSGIRTFIDGRGDMFGDPHVMSYSRIVAGNEQEFTAAVNRWNIRWAILARDDTALIAMLDRTPGWRRIRQDKVGIVFARA